MTVGIFTDTYYPELNGVANSAYQLKIGLEKSGHKVYVFTVTNPEVKDKEENVVRIRSMPFIFMDERRVGVSLVKRWLKKIKDLDLDIIHTQTEFSLGHFGRKAAKRLSIPSVHTYHTIYEEYMHYLKMPKTHNLNVKKIVRWLSRICCNKSDHVIVPSQKVEKLLLKYGVSKPIHVQATGIDPGKFKNIDLKKVDEIKNQLGLKENDKILIAIGRLAKEKNLEEIIDYMSDLNNKHPETKLLIVGDGAYRKELEKHIISKTLEEKVIFTGSIPWDSIQNYYALGNVFVCASTSETQGLTYFEAMAAGKPILVREDECLKGLIQVGSNGLTYQNKQEFFDAFEILFANNAYETYGIHAMETAVSFSVNAFVEGIAKIYEEVISEFGGGHVKEKSFSEDTKLSGEI